MLQLFEERLIILKEKVLSDKDVTGIIKCYEIQCFIDMFYNLEHYDSVSNVNKYITLHGKSASKQGISFAEEEHVLTWKYVDEACECLLQTNMYEKLGLNFNDLLSLELSVFNRLSKKMKEDSEKEAKRLDKINKNIDLPKL